MNNIVNQTPFLRTSRDFPREIQELSDVLSKTYIDIASMVNNRTIGIFPINRPAINGESWFITSQRQQGLRQIYTFTSTGNIPHGIVINSVERFTKPSGSFTDGTNWYGAIYGSTTPIPNQISFYITSTNIVVLAGVGAPAITKGTIILEWISNV